MRIPRSYIQYSRSWANDSGSRSRQLQLSLRRGCLFQLPFAPTEMILETRRPGILLCILQIYSCIQWMRRGNLWIFAASVFVNSIQSSWHCVFMLVDYGMRNYLCIFWCNCIDGTTYCLRIEVVDLSVCRNFRYRRLTMTKWKTNYWKDNLLTGHLF